MKIYTVSDALCYMIFNRNEVMVRDMLGDQIFTKDNSLAKIDSRCQLWITNNFNQWREFDDYSNLMVPHNKFILAADTCLFILYIFLILLLYYCIIKYILSLI